MSDMQRTDIEIKIGLLPMSGKIKKHRQFVGSVLTSYVSVNLSYVLLKDLNIVISMLQTEIEGVKKGFEESKKLFTSETR